MKFGRNRWGATVEVFGKQIHVGNQELPFARNLIQAIETLEGRNWSIEVQDFNCESHREVLEVKPGWADDLAFYHLEKYLGSLDRETVLKVCQDRLEAVYWGMYI